MTTITDLHWLAAIPAILLVAALMTLPWMGFMALFAHLSGWAKLGKRFKSDAPLDGERFGMTNGSMGTGFPVSYRNCLTVVVGRDAFALSMIFLFRYSAPRLVIPWRDVASVTMEKALIQDYAEICIADSPTFIRIRGDAGRSIEAAYRQATGR